MRGQVKYDVMVPHRAVDRLAVGYRTGYERGAVMRTKSLHVTNRIPRRLVEDSDPMPIGQQ